MKAISFISIFGALLFTSVGATGGYGDINKCVNDKLNNNNDKNEIQNRLHDRCKGYSGSRFNACVNNVVDYYRGKNSIDQSGSWSNLRNCLHDNNNNNNNNNHNNNNNNHKYNYNWNSNKNHNNDNRSKKNPNGGGGAQVVSIENCTFSNGTFMDNCTITANVTSVVTDSSQLDLSFLNNNQASNTYAFVAKCQRSEKDRSKFLSCVREMVRENKSHFSYVDQLKIITAVKESDINKNRRYLRGSEDEE